MLLLSTWYWFRKKFVGSTRSRGGQRDQTNQVSEAAKASCSDDCESNSDGENYSKAAGPKKELVVLGQRIVQEGWSNARRQTQVGLDLSCPEINSTLQIKYR